MLARAELATAIRVINLAGSDDRRDAFKKLANGTTLDWAFFPACTGLEKPLAYDGRIASRRCGRPLSQSEIGCYASHFKLWEWLARSAAYLMHVQILFLIFAAAERNDFRRQRPPPRIDLLNNEISCNPVDVRAIEQEIPSHVGNALFIQWWQLWQRGRGL